MISHNQFSAVKITPGVRRPDGEIIKYPLQYSRITPDDDIMLWPPVATDPMTFSHKDYTVIYHPNNKITINEEFTIISEQGAWRGSLRHGDFHMRQLRSFVDKKPVTYVPTFDD